MKEIKRIFANRRLCIGLFLILLLNGLLFVLEQTTQNYGLDCSLPQGFITGSFFGDEYNTATETVDAKAAYARYLARLEELKELPLADAVSTLEQEKSRLNDILTIDNLLKEKDEMFSIGALNSYQEQEPDLVQQLENGEFDLSDVKLSYVAVNNLLAQAEYLTGYGDYLDTIQKNKDSMLSFSIFNDPNSFSGRNIIKTAEEFEKLGSVPLTLGPDGAMDALMSFPITDYLLLAVLLLFGVSFLEERQKGLWSVVHSAPNGRLRLAVHRMAILFGASIFSVLLLYGTNLVIGFSIYGGTGDLGRSLQSVEVLGKLPVLCTVGSFLARYFLLRIAAAFFVSLLLWLLLTAINNVKYTIIVAAGVLVTEYSLYTFLPVQSVLNLLKYFNLFTYISLSNLYTNYLNIDIFGYPLGIRSISQFALLPLCLLLAAVCIFIHCHKKPAAGKDLLGRVAYGINSVTDKGLRRLGLFGMELHKTMWIQKGVVVLALFIYLAIGLSFTVTIPVSTAMESAARQYTAELEGEISDGTFARIDAIEAELDQIMADYENAKTAYENGEMEYPQFDMYARNAAAAQTNRDGLSTVRSHAEELRDKGTENGFVPWLIEDTPYESVYGTASQSNQHQAAIVAVIALTLLLAGCIAYERQSGMTFLLSSTPRGRGRLLVRKIAISAVITTIVWAVIYGLELYHLFSEYAVQTLQASVQNLSMLERFPVNCSIYGWLVILYVYRWLMMFCGALIVLLISSSVKRVEMAYIVGCGAMLIPSLLYAYLGIETLQPLAYIMSVEAAPLLTRANGTITHFLLWGVALTVIAGLVAVWLSVSANRLNMADIKMF